MSRKIKTIILKKDPNADSRTAKANTTRKELLNATKSHISGVADILHMLANEIEIAGTNHDYTKLEYFDQFYTEFTDANKNGKKFTESNWYKMHVTTERHHLFSSTPRSVDLIDILEMIADCIDAGLTRSGNYRPLELPPELLQEAVKNTENFIFNNVKVVN